MKHFTSDRIQDYIDGIVDENFRIEIESHLPTCIECTEKYKVIKKLEETLRKLPLEQVDTNFTHKVMTKLGIQESPSIVWSVLKNIAPIFALILIVSIIYGMFKISGVLEGSGIGESIISTQSAYETLTRGFSDGVSTFNLWIKNLFPFFYAKNNLGLTIFLVVLFIIVALLDKFILMPLVKRRL